ncbi:MAG: hypothetical protein J7521_00145 [Caulobacter sp.]|nr:hypothetical protein [Caulobacter sp.]
MTAIACLRILIAEDASGPGRVSTAQVEAAADLYLKHRWKAPRRYGAVAPLAFVLADTRAERLDPEEMQALAVELESGLFPGRKAGQVCLMTFEGDETAVLQFASLSQAQLAGLIAGRGYDGPAGHVQVITAEEIRAVPSAQEAAPESAVATVEVPAPAAAGATAAPITPDPKPAAAKSAPAPKAEAAPKPASAKAAAKPVAPPPAPKPKAEIKPPPPPSTGWWGLYHPPSEAFVGAVIGLLADLEKPRPEDDAALLTRDMTCLNDAQSAFGKSAEAGMLFLPFSFWNLTTPASQEAYKRRMSRYPLDMQGRLGATVYDTPREPSLGLLAQIRDFLRPTFAHIDLNIADPSFPVATLPGDLAGSISLALTGDDPRQRIEAIARFAAAQASYRGKGVRQAVTNVRDARELEACRAAGLRFVSGPAITSMMPSPIGAAPTRELPLKVA